MKTLKEGNNKRSKFKGRHGRTNLKNNENGLRL